MSLFVGRPIATRAEGQIPLGLRSKPVRCLSSTAEQDVVHPELRHCGLALLGLVPRRSVPALIAGEPDVPFRQPPGSRAPKATDEALGQRNAKTTEDVALGIRRRVFEHTIRNNGGYLSQACSAAEQLAWLYNEELHIGKSTLPLVPEPFGGVPSAANTTYRSGAGYNGPARPEFDRLIIVPAHYALVTYATLAEVGRIAPKGRRCSTRTDRRSR